MNIELPPMSEAAARMVRIVPIMANGEAAARIQTELCTSQHHALNDANLSIASHVMTRALIIHSTLHSAAIFMADATGTPLPDAWRAVLDLSLNLPLAFDTVEIKTS